MTVRFKNQTNEVLNLIPDLINTQPRLYEALSRLAKQVSDITTVVQDSIAFTLKQQTSVSGLTPPTGFGGSINPTGIELHWNSVNPDVFYEIRYVDYTGGTTWDDATYLLRTRNTSVNINPIKGLQLGFIIKSVDNQGHYSVLTEVLNLFLGNLEVSVPIVNSFGNNNIISWTPPVLSQNFKVDFYTFICSTVTVITKLPYANIYRPVAGAAIAFITPTDIAGNEGVTTTVNFTSTGNADYLLIDNFNLLLDANPTNMIGQDVNL